MFYPFMADLAWEELSLHAMEGVFKCKIHLMHVSSLPSKSSSRTSGDNCSLN